MIVPICGTSWSQVPRCVLRKKSCMASLRLRPSPKRLHHDVDSVELTPKHRRLSAPATASNLHTTSTTPAQSHSGWRCPHQWAELCTSLGNEFSANLTGTMMRLLDWSTRLGASKALLVDFSPFNHVLRSLRASQKPVKPRSLFRLCPARRTRRNFDLLGLLDVAAAFGIASEPLPQRRAGSAYLLHSPGHFVAVTPTRLGYLLCDSLLPLPFILTSAELEAVLTLYCHMQLQTAHTNMSDTRRTGGWTGMCLWRRQTPARHDAAAQP